MLEILVLLQKTFAASSFPFLTSHSIFKVGSHELFILVVANALSHFSDQKSKLLHYHLFQNEE